MAKDKSLLESVSKYFTESSLANIVAKSLNEDAKNVTILSWDFDNESVKKGDSYLSTVDRVTIKSKIKNQEKETKIFVKSLPNNLVRRKTFRSVEFFHNEIMFYAKVIIDYYFSKLDSSKDTVKYMDFIFTITTNAADFFNVLF